MTNKIILKKSNQAGKIPLGTDLDFGEVAINYADGKLYYKNTSGAVGLIGGADGGGGALLRIYQRGDLTEADTLNITITSGVLSVFVRTSTDPLGVIGVAV
jgi:hypothetical protein